MYSLYEPDISHAVQLQGAGFNHRAVEDLRRLNIHVPAARTNPTYEFKMRSITPASDFFQTEPDCVRAVYY
jgi:hypothetical protein